MANKQTTVLLFCAILLLGVSCASRQETQEEQRGQKQTDNNSLGREVDAQQKAAHIATEREAARSSALQQAAQIEATRQAALQKQQRQQSSGQHQEGSEQHEEISRQQQEAITQRQQQVVSPPPESSTDPRPQDNKLDAQDSSVQSDSQDVAGTDFNAAEDTTTSIEAKTTGEVTEQPAAVSPPPQPAYTLPGGLTISNVSDMVHEAAARIWGDPDSRQLGSGLALLYQLADILDDALPQQNKVRTRRLPEGLQPPYLSPDVMVGAVVTSGADGSLQVSPASPALPAKPLTLAEKIDKFRDTGVDVAGQGVFAMAALDSAGVLPRAQGEKPAAYIQRLHQAAQAGCLEALLALADRYFTGHGTAKSCSTAANYARQAASILAVEAERDMRFTVPPASLDLRERHMDARYTPPDEMENDPRAVSMEEDMAQRGSLAAQRRMAYRRLVGQGMEADPEGAFHDFQAAAAQGDAFSIFNLGYMYLRGLGPAAQNSTEARVYFEQSAEKGMAAGWNGLGVLHWHGQGGEVNLTAAHECFLKGAAHNHSDSLYNLALMEANGIGVAKNESAGLMYYQLADNHGHWKAAFNLALMYENGMGTDKDCNMAELYYRKFFRERGRWPKALTSAAHALHEGDAWGALAQYIMLAEQGNTAAALNVGWMLRHGQGYQGPGYLDTALLFFERAALQNSSAGAIEAGMMVLEADTLGLSRPSDATAAVRWFTQAADLNNTEALYLMGWVHQHGVGLPEPNTTLAADFYRRSVASAGRVRSRAIVPRVALVSLAADAWLEPWFGPNATTRAAAWVAQHMGRETILPGPPSLNDRAPLQLSQPGGESDREEGAGGLTVARVKAWALRVQGRAMRVYHDLGVHQVDEDTVVVTVLAGVLALVLWARRRQMGVHVA